MRYGFDELFKRTKKAIIKHNLISDEKNIMVGLSGGKDSAVLLYVLKEFQRISKYKYNLAAGHIDLGFNGTDLSNLEKYCQKLDVPLYLEKTDIGKIIFEVRKEKNPCSLCAKMRRGALNNLAKANGYDKIALGHHQDDAIETLLLNIFYEGRIASFNPLTYLDRIDITVIRPLVYVPESLVSYIARKEQVPIIESACPANGFTKRQDMKSIVSEIDKLSRGNKDRAIISLEKLFDSRWDGKNIEKLKELDYDFS